MSSRIVRLAMCLTVFVLAASTGLRWAHAGDSADAHLRKGYSLLKQNRESEAFAEFLAAYGIEPSATAAAQMGMAESSLKRWLEAERHLMEAREQENDEWVGRNRPYIDEQLKRVRAHIGTVEIEGSPGAEISANGVSLGRLPLPQRDVRLAEGEVTIEGRLAGFDPVRKVVSVVPGEIRHAVIDFPRPTVVATAPKYQPGPAAPVSAPVILPAPAASAKVAPPPASPKRERPRKGPFMTALPFLTFVTGAGAVVSGQTILPGSESCDWYGRKSTGSCRVPNKALFIGGGVVGMAEGGLAVVLTPFAYATESLVDPEVARFWFLFLGGVSAASAMLSGGVMTYYDGPTVAWRKGVGIGTLSMGVATGVATVLAAFERTPANDGPHVSIAPMPNGMSLVGSF
jgi:hypothetical protein